MPQKTIPIPEGATIGTVPIPEGATVGSPMQSAEPSSPLRRLGSLLLDKTTTDNPMYQFQAGALKSLGSTLYNTSSLVNRGLRSFQTPSGRPLENAIAPMPDKPEFLNPQGIAQNIGGLAEQTAEFFLPAGQTSKAGAAIEGATKSGLLRTLSKAGVEGLATGGISELQGGSPEAGAAIGATGVVVPAALKAILPQTGPVSMLIKALRPSRTEGEFSAITKA